MQEPETHDRQEESLCMIKIRLNILKPFIRLVGVSGRQPDKQEYPPHLYIKQ